VQIYYEKNVDKVKYNGNKSKFYDCWLKNTKKSGQNKNGSIMGGIIYPPVE
jgi:hypothetical protein